MLRREFIAGLAGAAAWPVVAAGAAADDAGDPVPGTMERLFLPSYVQGLAETGYAVGRNVIIERREGDRLPALAADLVRRQVTVIVAAGNGAARAAKAATKTVPVVFGILGDPIEVGVVASLSRPSTSRLSPITWPARDIVSKCEQRYSEGSDNCEDDCSVPKHETPQGARGLRSERIAGRLV